MQLFPRSQKCALCLRHYHRRKSEVDKTNTGTTTSAGSCGQEKVRCSLNGVMLLCRHGQDISLGCWCSHYQTRLKYQSLTPILCAVLCAIPPQLCCATAWHVCLGDPSCTPAPGWALIGSWHYLLSQGRCRQMGESVENLPKVDPAIFKLFTRAVCSQRVFLEGKPVTEVPPLLVQGPAAEVCTPAGIHTVQPWGPPEADERLSQLWRRVAKLLCHLLLKWVVVCTGGGGV